MLSKERGKYFQEKWDEMEYKFANMEMKQQIDNLNNKLKDIKEYVNYLVIFNQTINGKFSETQWGQDILDLIGDDNE